MTVAIIDYGSGNLRSAAKAFERAVRDHGLAEDVAVTPDAERVATAEHIVLPGVGAFADCRRGLLALDGMMAALDEAVRLRGRPFLGICVGMQLMATRGLEHGEHPGFDWIAGDVREIPAAPGRPVPHMGWNDLRVASGDHPVLRGIEDGDHAYFVHSYALVCEQPADVLATVDYGRPLAAVVGHGNIIGTQFHPEKSQAIGLKFLANFLSWRP
ncbi:MAG: imidazole glycerol phosphate synthase subunit HisH [Alphaproteobacteria bacterium]|nr:imidazole glycerol phosphate synthase subunit HisH [Alphaproteobacteria bacterium]